jgi:ATP-dependent DNA helicase UvrD/PcrA
MVLAHARTSARNACGLRADTEGGDSKVARLARAAGTYHAKASSGRAREACLVVAEQALLDLMGMYEEQSSVARLVEQHGIDRRWLRRLALQQISQLPPTCANSDDARNGWVVALQTSVAALNLSYGHGSP